jgi:DeoR/GlpR family transcriptional regulator of sugar metabolism
MLVIERQRFILERVRRKGVIAVRDVARELGAPEVTVRRDLAALAGRGLIKRTHGGAVLASEFKADSPNHLAGPSLPSEAIDIAIAAASLVGRGDSVILGGGSATLALARELADLEDLTVITNSLATCAVLINAKGIELIVTGGSVRTGSMTLVGPSVELSLRGLRASTAFITGDGLTARHGLSTGNIATAAAYRAAAAASARVVALVEGSAVGQANLCQIVSCQSIDIVITGAGADGSEIALIKDVGVEVRAAPTAVDQRPDECSRDRQAK